MSTQQHADDSIPILKRIWCWTQIFLHVVNGLAVLLIRFPLATQKEKDSRIQKWSCRLLEIFGIQLRIHGSKILLSEPFLLAANHISWMDIHAINACIPIRFVAKSEVEGWPIFGWMAKQLGTVFIKRDNSRHARHIAGEVGKVLNTQSICIFPEGTSTEGEALLPFKPNLFESAIIAKVPVYSLAISYKSSITGLRSTAAAFVGDMGLLESMSNILNTRNLVVELTFLLPSGSSSEATRDRKWLALHSQEAISNQLGGIQQFM